MTVGALITVIRPEGPCRAVVHAANIPELPTHFHWKLDRPPSDYLPFLDDGYAAPSDEGLTWIAGWPPFDSEGMRAALAAYVLYSDASGFRRVQGEVPTLGEVTTYSGIFPVDNTSTAVPPQGKRR